jgi:hypothetical protein
VIQFSKAKPPDFVLKVILLHRGSNYILGGEGKTSEKKTLALLSAFVNPLSKLLFSGEISWSLLGA